MLSEGHAVVIERPRDVRQSLSGGPKAAVLRIAFLGLLALYALGVYPIGLVQLHIAGTWLAVKLCLVKRLSLKIAWSLVSVGSVCGWDRYVR